jgi:hypothetical protein
MRPVDSERNIAPMNSMMKCRYGGVFYMLCIGLIFLLSTGATTAYAATSPPTLQQESSAQAEEATNAPRDCIDPLMASHIAATLLSLLPLPGWADAADAAAYALNIALKHCPPDLQAPPDIVITQPNQGCLHHLRLPTPNDIADLVAMDRAIIEELLADPEVNLTPSQRAEFMAELDAEFGRFMNHAYDSYTNVYGVALPIQATSFDVPYWDEIGTPSIFHYNSDVLIEVLHPGTRISPYLIAVPVGNHQLRWTGKTTISEFDYIPFFVGTSAYRAYKAAQAQATKRFAIDATKGALKEAIEQMLREGNRFFAKQIAKDIAREILIEAVITSAEQIYESTPYYAGGQYTGAETTAFQKLTIVDANPPTISGANDVVLEATDPGGMQARRKLGELRAQITVSDDCDQNPTLTYNTPDFWPLLVDGGGNPLPSAQINWRASDDGAASAAGGVNTTQVAQQITIVDTTPPLILAPPPVMMYTKPGGVEVPLGNPQTFDIVDLRPTVQYNAPDETTPGVLWPIFGAGVHHVEWTATDQSNNTSDAVMQLVNIKQPDTNTTPVAFAQSGGNTVQAIADEPVVITVRGEDNDKDDSGMRDPIWFRIDQYPNNGFFIAPLYPYFVDDYRITARYSPQIAAAEGEDFALALAQDPDAMREYIIDLCEIDKERKDLPNDFVSFYGGDEKYMAVDDDGFTYIYDQFYNRCHHGDGTISPDTAPRISVWDANGVFVGQQERSDGGHQLRDVKFDIARGYILSVESDSSSTGTSSVYLSAIQTHNPAEPIVEIEFYGLSNDINRIVVNEDGDTRRPQYLNAGKAVWDNDAGVLYVVGDPNHNLRGMAAFTPAPCDSNPGGDPDDCLNLLDVQVYSDPIVKSTEHEDFPGVGVDAMRLQRIRDIALDSLGNVYLLTTLSNGGNFDRIYKFGPAIKHPDGSITLGEFMGWLGKCDSGANCNYIDHHSIGFACTDATCAVEGPTSGNLPGQLNNAAAIAMDRNDVLYVADFGNQRVQRFSPDGLFAGEAKSQAACEDCSGFVLGDFGSPGNIAVNASHFYILDKDAELVHIFEASVIHSIDDKSAWVEYQSKSNYVGADSFTFRATDGFHTDQGELIESEPATVAINVARNHRPPLAEDGASTTQEETPKAVTLEGYDLDGALDTLTYAISFAPQHGTLSGKPPNVTYHPYEDFAGIDTFRFTISDGASTSNTATYSMTVTPLNDTPEVVPDASSLQAGLGHAVTIHAAVLDPDEGDTLSAMIDWGDGTQETNQDLAMTGGTEGPSLTPLVDGRADFLAYHTYQAAGSYTVIIEVADSAGAKGTAQVQVTVEAMADLVLGRSAKSLVPHTSQQYAYELTVTNQRSSAGHGIAANNVQLSEVLTGSVSYQTAIPASGNCQVESKSITCNLGNLNPDQLVKVTVQLQMGAPTGSIIALDGNTSAATADPILENNRDLFDLAVVPVGDFYVDSYRDSTDADPGDGVCATAQNECTVRAAIMEANALADAQTVVFGSGVYVLEGEAESAAGSATAEASGDLDIQSDIILLGIGAQKSTLHGNAVDRVLEIHSGNVRLENLSITGGYTTEGDGGGIRNGGGSVHLRRVSIHGNQAVNGGGVMNSGGELSITESSLSGNSALSSGGGIMNQAQLTVENVTISGNQANDGGALQGAGGNAQLLYVTIVGNSAANDGGGINSTGNAVRIENTLLAGNDATTGPDCALELVSGGHNLIGSLQDCALSGSTGGNVMGEPPRVDVLTGNAAETYSHPLLAGSPALGSATCLRATDQSGAQRPTETGCDIGAYEAGALGIGVYMPIIGK